MLIIAHMQVMHYPFEKHMILKPEQYYETGIHPAGGLSADDKRWVRAFYPPISPNDSLPVLKAKTAYFQTFKAGEQLDLRVMPAESKSYTFQTTGESDTVMVLMSTTGTENGKGVLLQALFFGIQWGHLCTTEAACTVMLCCEC